MTFTRPAALTGALLFLGVIGAARPAAARHPVPHPDARRRVERDRRGGRHQQGWPPRHRLRRELVRGPGLDEAQIPRPRLLEQLHRRLQRHADRRRRRRLSGHRQRHLVCEEDLLVQEPRQGRRRLGRGADQRRLQHRVRDAGRHGQRRQGERDRRAGERHRSVVVRGQYSPGLGRGRTTAQPGLDQARGQRQELRPRHRRTATSTRTAATTS